MWASRLMFKPFVLSRKSNVILSYSQDTRRIRIPKSWLRKTLILRIVQTLAERPGVCKPELSSLMTNHMTLDRYAEVSGDFVRVALSLRRLLGRRRKAVCRDRRQLVDTNGQAR